MTLSLHRAIVLTSGSVMNASLKCTVCFCISSFFASHTELTVHPSHNYLATASASASEVQVVVVAHFVDRETRL